MKNLNKILNISCLLIIAMLVQKTSLAQDTNSSEPVEEKVEKTTEEIETETKNKAIEEKAKTDTYNLNYYPKLQFGTPNLFTGAATLNGNEVFARIGLTSF